MRRRYDNKPALAQKAQRYRRNWGGRWAGILPADRAELASTEVFLVGAGIRSRQTAVAALRDEDPQAEWERVTQEVALMRSAASRRGGPVGPHGS